MLELTLRLVASLAVVVGLLMLLARFAGRRFRGQSGALVRVVHRQPLSRTSAVAVVAVGSRLLVLGTTEQQVNVLTELDAADLDDLTDLTDLTDLEDLDALEDLRLEGEPAPGDRPRPVLVPPARSARPAGAHRAATTPVRATNGALSGSVLSAATWRQALAAATGKAS